MVVDVLIPCNHTNSGLLWKAEGGCFSIPTDNVYKRKEKCQKMPDVFIEEYYEAKRVQKSSAPH